VSVISEWLRQQRAIHYREKHQVSAIALPPNIESAAIVEEKGEGVLLAGAIMFDSSLCGIRLILDTADTERWFRCDRMFSFGMINPQEHLWLSRYDTVNNYYVIMNAHERYFGSQLRIVPFNEDTAAHNILTYNCLYAMAGDKLRPSAEDLLQDLRDKLAPPPVERIERPTWLDPQRLRAEAEQRWRG